MVPGAIVLTPSKLRLDSRHTFLGITLSWLTNVFFCYLLLAKLLNELDASWWLVCLPFWIHHAGDVLLNLGSIYYTDYFIFSQIGPAPGIHASAGMHLQYRMIYSCRAKTHIVAGFCGLVETTASLAVKAIFCWGLASGRVQDGTLVYRMVFAPLWLGWLATAVLGLLKDRSERLFGNPRDLIYIFTLFVAFKLDGLADYSWKVVFLIPWMGFGALALLALLLGGLLAYSRIAHRAPVHEMLLPFGFFCLVCSTAPQCLAAILLVQLLDGDSNVALASILVPCALSWAAAWLSGVLVCIALRQKEILRAGLVEAGLVWTAHEAVARRMEDEVETQQRRIDMLSEAQISALVEEMMAGKAKPAQLVRVGATLYRRVATSMGSDPSAGDGVAVVSLAPDATAKSGGAAGPRGHACLDGALARVEEEGSKRRAVEQGAKLEDDDAARVRDGQPDNAVAATAGGAAVAGSGGHGVRAAPGLDYDQDTPTERSRRMAPLHIEAAESAGNTVHVTVISSPSAGHTKETHGLATRTPSGYLLHIDGKDKLISPIMSRATSSSLGEDPCVICFEGVATCVFLECGHGGFCRRCAYHLFVRPPNECPQCRSKIEQVVELDCVTKVGQPTTVKA